MALRIDVEGPISKFVAIAREGDDDIGKVRKRVHSELWHKVADKTKHMEKKAAKALRSEIACFAASRFAKLVPITK